MILHFSLLASDNLKYKTQPEGWTQWTELNKLQMKKHHDIKKTSSVWQHMQSIMLTYSMLHILTMQPNTEAYIKY